MYTDWWQSRGKMGNRQGERSGDRDGDNPSHPRGAAEARTCRDSTVDKLFPGLRLRDLGETDAKGKGSDIRANAQSFNEKAIGSKLEILTRM